MIRIRVCNLDLINPFINQIKQKILPKTLALKEQGLFLRSPKNRPSNFAFKGVFCKIGTIISDKSNFLHIRSI